MESSKYKAELESYAKKGTNFVASETLQRKEHMLIVENAGSKQLKDIYMQLDDLTEADLIDFFELERRNGGKL